MDRDSKRNKEKDGACASAAVEYPLLPIACVLEQRGQVSDR